jgi:hypothetical protein
MTAITENGADWKPNTGESIRGCVNPWIGKLPMPVQSYDDCGQCGDVPYRVLVIESEFGKPRGVALCGRHFVEACKQCSDRTPCLLDDDERLDLIRIALPNDFELPSAEGKDLGSI